MCIYKFFFICVSFSTAVLFCLSCFFIGALTSDNRGCPCICQSHTYRHTHIHTHTHTDTHTHDVNICYGFLSQYIGSIRGERRKKRRRRRKISASNVPPTNLCPPPSSLPGPQGLIDPLPCDLWPGFRGSGEVTKPVPYWLIQLTQTSTCPDQMQKNKQIWYWPLKVDCVMEEKKT